MSLEKDSAKPTTLNQDRDETQQQSRLKERLLQELTGCNETGIRNAWGRWACPL